MPTTRVHVPMTEETRSSLEALADARGGTLTAVCRDLLADCAPVALEMAKAIQIAKQTPARALREMNESMDKQLAQISQLQLDMTPKATYRKYPKRKKTG